MIKNFEVVSFLKNSEVVCFHLLTVTGCIAWMQMKSCSKFWVS